MPANLIWASTVTLGLLFGFLFSILLVLEYFAGNIPVDAMLLMTVGFNVALWIIGPTITDIVHRFFYKAEFLDIAAFRARHPDAAEYLGVLAQANGIKTPSRIIMIADQNPTAYVYGSGAFNARLAISQGLFTYLDEREVRAVLAHEMGHIVHRDFIVMAVANTLVQILYELSQILMRNKGNRGGGSDRKGNGLFYVVGITAYVFYIIGFYLMLFLSRVREGYADRFAAESTRDPHALASALVKIAYGIVATEDSARSTRLLESTQTLGIMGVKAARSVGVVQTIPGADASAIARIMRFDIVSPWAWLSELSSTHPLTGRRLLALDDIAEHLGQGRLFNIRGAIESEPIDRVRLWKGFWIDVCVFLLPHISFAGMFVALAILAMGSTEGTWEVGRTVLSAALGIFGVSLLIRAMYRFPDVNTSTSTSVLALMQDPYASPVRGIPVSLEGAVIGRGVPGYVFSEDMMFQDRTGFMYLDYQAGIPLVGNVIFAWKRVQKFFGKFGVAKGWFFRSNYQMLTISEIAVEGGFAKGYARFWHIALGLIMLGAAVGVGAVKSRDVLVSSAASGAVIAVAFYVLLYALLASRNRVSHASSADPEVAKKVESNRRKNMTALGVLGLVILALVILSLLGVE